MTDRGFAVLRQRCQDQKEGEQEFGNRLVDLEVRQILEFVRHPQTDGKLERLHGEIQRKIPKFERY